MLAPLPVAMVSVGDKENANIITIAWAGVICSTPPRVYISVRPERFSHSILMERKEFVLNLTDKSLTTVADFCGFRSGRDCDKFAEMNLTKLDSDIVAAPLIDECPVNLECKVFDIVNLGSHDMFMADVVAVHVDQKIMKDGKVDVQSANLVNYQHGEYYQNGKQLARFGFSIQKKFIKQNGKGKAVNIDKASLTKRKPPKK
jgi:flavin reductase (DIM6/NTAB) family NADH-FMN oxidoreductase RutF